MEATSGRTLGDILALGSIALAGAGMLAVAVWSWAGRSARARRWARRPWGPRMRLGLLPGGGLLLLFGSLGTLFDLSQGPTVLKLGLSFLFFFGLLLVAIGGLSWVPRWWGPRWYRDRAAD